MDRQKRLRVAAIMDEFTYNCYAPECDLLQITPHNFKAEIDGFLPDLLLIETVWRGKDNLWRFKLNDNTEQLRALTGYCRENKIPVVFWSKEDPVHFGVFIRAASFADVVFTTDADCIELYKERLGHSRVYYLPFAAQPSIHNPMEEYERKDRFCFAGSFYVKYKERSQAFMNLVPLLKARGLDIYDRNYKKGETDNNTQSTSIASPAVQNYYFPPELQECILGSLPYHDISRAYKGYRYGVNLTSMVQSGFMFARRAFELLASNTVTVSNYSRGLTLLFGDLLIATNNPDRMAQQLDAFCGTELNYRKYRLAGLRHVLASHLYEDRLDRIAQKALGRSIKRPLPEILVVCPEENARVRDMFARQTYDRKALLIGCPETPLAELSFDYVTVFSPEDYYGENYLLDFALATRFSSDQFIGKAAFYSAGALRHREKAYTHVQEPVQLTRQMAARSCFDAGAKAGGLPSFHPCASILSLDEFNYCQHAAACQAADDLALNTGISLDKIYAYTDQIPPAVLHKRASNLTQQLWETLRIEEGDLVRKTYENGALRLERQADDDQIVWLRTEQNFAVETFTTGSRIGFFSQLAEKTGNIRCQIEYYDENNVKLDFMNFELGRFSLLRISSGAKTFKLIFRLRGRASATVTALGIAVPDTLLPAPFPLRDSLLIAEEYPSYTHPNQAEPLHRFARENGLEVLLVGGSPCYLPYSEYEGVPITSDQYDAIPEYLAAGRYRHIYVSAPSEELRKRLAGYPIEALPI